MTYLNFDNSHVLVSNANGLRIIDVNSFKEVPIITALKKFQFKQIRKLNYTNSGNIIFFLVDKGIHEYNPSTGKVTEITTINKLLRAQTMLRDVINLDDDNLMFAFDGFVILHTDREYNIIDHYKQDEDLITSLKNDGVYDIFIDKEERIWVATYGGGINMNDPFILSFTLFA